MKLLVELIRESLKKHSDNIAYIDNSGNRKTTYAQLDELSDKIAAKIVAEGGKPGDIIPVILPRQAEYIAAEIGIMKAGCAFAPLITDYPRERIEYIIKDCGSTFAVDSDFIDVCRSMPASAIDRLPDEEDAGAVIYTSGSTGRPKGIIHTQRSLTSGILRQRDLENISENDVCLSTVTHSFSVSLPENYLPLIAGAAVVMLNDDERRDIRFIEDAIERYNVTNAYINPGQLRLFNNKGKSLKIVTAVGERLCDTFSADYDIINIYGTSETLLTLAFRVDKSYRNTPIGAPVPGVNAYILDNEGNPVEDGTEGELCVSGLISKGYLNLPEQTKSAYAENPYSTGDDDKVLFHTNDIVKRLDNGDIVYVNRKDWMVKINGQRVETGEIEICTKKISGVKDAVVKAFENEYGQTYLAEFFTGDSVSESDIKAGLQKDLPDYMIPLFFVKLDEFPRNANGKIDRLALKKPDASMFKKEYKAPNNETESILCEKFSEILNCGKVGVNDDFFDLGGDSIKVMMLQNQCAIPAVTTEIIYECRTPGQISKRISSQTQDIIAECIGSDRDSYPLTPSQMGIYLACTQNPQSTMYNTPCCYTFPKSCGIDTDRLIKAVGSAVKNHQSFSFVIDDSSGTPVMKKRPAEVEVPVINVANDDLERAKRDFVKPFNIKGDRLFRFALFETETSFCFAMDYHHIAFDGTSVSVICDEISRAYAGEEIEKEKMGQFDLSLYEERLESTEKYKDAENYQDSLFGGLEVNSMLAADMQEDTGVEDKPCGTFSVSLPAKISAEAVAGFVKSLGITENTLFLGAFEYAVAKYTGQEEAVVCTVNHGRHDGRMKNTVGMLVRTMPLYVKIDEESTVCNFLTEAEKNLRLAIKHDCYPFVKLATKYGLNTDVLFVYQSDAFNSFEIGGNVLHMERIPVYSAQSPLSVMMFKADGGYQMELEYRSDLYKEDTVKSFANMFVLIISEMIKREKLCEIQLVNSAGRSRIDEINKKTETDADLSVGFVRLFRNQVKKTPDKTALVFKENSYTYRQLDELTEKIALYLRKKGISADDAVPVLVQRSEYMTICAIGVLKSGAAYEPLDPTHPSERLQFMIKDAGANLIIADEKLMGMVPDFTGEVLKISDIEALPLTGEEIPDPGMEDSFVLLYTSGSTGVPKGCVLSHKNIANVIHWLSKLWNISESSAVAAYASYGFDAHMIDIYAFLSSGATEYIIPEEKRLDLFWINNYCRENNISCLFATTQVGRAFLTSIDDIAPEYVGMGGETLVPFTPNGKTKVFNLYGPTECTIAATAFRVDGYYNPIPIGTGVDNAHLYVVDKQMRLLPVGAVGELCIAGPLVSKGYLNRPEQNAKIYVKNPFEISDRYNRLYHTGDIVRFLCDGNLSYVGRRDGMVKIRGYRIELSEVESVIRDYPGIKDATVIAGKQESGGKYVAAYVVSDEKIDIEDLKDFISQRKPPFMVPEHIMQIDSIPLNVNGKVDKRNLPKIKATDVTTASKGGTNRTLTTLEKEILAIVSGIIGSDEIDIGDDLMRCGMTSLSVIKLAVELNKTYGYSADIKSLMKGCSIISIESDIIDFLRSAVSSAVAENQEQDEQTDRDWAPLSFTQYGVYSECMKRPYDTFYNIPFLLKFPVSIDAKRLAKAAETVLKAHPYIFTRLGIKDDDVVQIKNSPGDFSVTVSKMNRKQFEEFRRNYIKPYNLMKSTLFKVEIIETEAGIYLLTDFHHIIFDGASFGIFTEELKNAYDGNALNAEDYTYFDYVRDEALAESGGKFKEAEDYIAKMLSQSEGAQEITPDLPGPEDEGSPAMVSVPIDMQAISRFTSESGVTPAHLFLASMLYVVSRFTNSRGAYISTISNGRSDLRLRRCFGMFVKTLPIGAQIDDVTAIEFVKTARELLINSVANEVYPYARVCRKFNYSPNILYAYQLGVDEDLFIGNQLIEKEALAQRRLKFKTAVYIEKTDGKECINVLYNDGLYSAGLMQTFARSIAVTAEKIISNPQGKIRKFTLLDAAGEQKIENFSVTAQKEPEIKLLHRLFENQVSLHPDRAALCACDGKFTYSQLDNRANAVANSLIKYGVGVGSRVVILLNRTSRFFAAMFGILKAGGAFIPSCPEYPVERIENIISDSGADFVITESDCPEKYPNALSIDDLENGGDSSNPNIDVSPDDLAYLIYTSGSTGKPKGVMLKHIGIASYLTDDENNIQIRSITENCTCYGSVTTVSFDMSLKETMGSLCNGLTLAFADDEQTMNPVSLAQFFNENNVDVFNATPSRLLLYMELPEFAEAMRNCKVILSGGEKYSAKLLQVLRQNTNAKILNTYGPTEITVSSNAKDLTFADEITVGRPLLNYKEYVVDADGNKLPPNVVGELIIAGLGVAAGYNNLPKQTQEAFIDYCGERFYRSGDYARWTDDGDIVILGRKDNQVKLRGLRIELGEIEKCLTSIEGIRSGVVVIKKLGNEDGICAYFTADRKMNPEQLKEEMKKSLTDYMIPSSFNQLDELPLTPNGKVNLKALSEPVAAEKREKKADMPVTAAEKMFCRIFGEILDNDNISATDSFFDLGGTSLTVTRVVIAAGKENCNISYGDVFSHPTPRMLAQLTNSDSLDEDGLVNISDYDYSAIEEVLKNNTLESFKTGEMQKLGDVILTGATGFLGIHILNELLKNHSGKIYCLLRGKDGVSAEERIKSMFYYYFEEALSEKYPGRLQTVEGDITNKESFNLLCGLKADTFINCAANVKHFSKGTDIEDVNFHGVENILNFCRSEGLRLVHVSTMSVGGLFVGEPGSVSNLCENQLYFGQTLSSKYTVAKFLAERKILESAAKGMNVKIMRVGTLAPRESDGEYQINFTTNSFMGRLKSTYLVGCYPFESMDMPFELSPIDYTAKAILLLAQTPVGCTVFHPYNNHALIMNDLYAEMDKSGLKSHPAENDEYSQALSKAKEDPEKAKVLSSFIAYQNMAHGKKTYPVGKSNALTMQVLYRMGFRWPVTSLDYMKRFLTMLEELGYFG